MADARIEHRGMQSLCLMRPELAAPVRMEFDVVGGRRRHRAEMVKAFTKAVQQLPAHESKKHTRRPVLKNPAKCLIS